MAFRWVRFWLLLFVGGLMVSGVTAIPLASELNIVYRGLHHFDVFHGAFHDWIQAVYSAILDTQSRYPFLLYGTDWLAFGHFVVAVAFIGPLRDPVRNRWVVEFGIISCVLVIPYALIFGALRGIPWWWRLIDCAFGIFGLIPLLMVRRIVRRLERGRSVPNEIGI